MQDQAHRDDVGLGKRFAEEVHGGHRHAIGELGARDRPSDVNNHQFVRRSTRCSETITVPMTTDFAPRPRSLLDCDGPYALRDMPVQVKALKSATCHLTRDHGLDEALVRADASRLMELHFAAHGFDPAPSYPAASLPWRIRCLPHDTMERQGRMPPHQ